MENLGNDLLENILFRLPLGTSSSQAKRVCKSWKSILSNRPHNEVGYLFAYHKYDDFKGKDGKILLYFGEKYDHIDCNKMNHYYSHDTLMEMEHCRFVFKSVFKSYEYYDILVGSCNGLVCFQKADPGKVREPFAICNPLTGEFIYLKANFSRVGDCKWVSSGFGYCHSTGEYKVVRLYSITKEQRVPYAQVYTIGSNKWRDVETFIDVTDHQLYYACGIFANGFLHWLADDDRIVIFDLEDENFGELPLLPAPDVGYKELKLLGGNLCWVNRNFTGMDIWAYKKRNLNTNNSRYGTKEGDQKRDYCSKHSWNWVKEFSIGYRGWLESPFSITKTNQVLMLGYCYDPETGTISRQGNHKCMDQVIPHANSYVSLKEFGETWYGPGLLFSRNVF